MSIRTPEKVSQDIIAHLKLLDPDMSASIGSPERKLIDAVSSVISGSYIQSQLTSSIWDIDTKSGIELEEFVGLFGFGRRQGSRANGVLVIELQSPAPQDYVIPIGTKASTLATLTRPAMTYETTASVVIPLGASYAEVPADCTEIGASGNTPAATIVSLENWTSVATVVNPVAFINGRDAETDEELRARFKATFLRNLAGTEDFYAALCLNHINVSKVRVIGPVERNVEQLQAVLNAGILSMQSSINYSKFAYPQGTIIYKDEETYYTEGLHYTVNTSTPQILITCEKVTDDEDNAFIHEGDIVTVESEYCSTASRNNPSSGITNRVDIYVNGSESTVTNEHSLINWKQFTDPFLTGRTFVDDNGETMSSGRLQILGYGPVISLPPTLTIGETTYTQRTASAANDYRLVRETGPLAGSTSAVYGILFTDSLKYPSKGEMLELSYAYNRVPMILDELIRLNKQITTDVMVHEAEIVPLGINVIMQLSAGYSELAVKEEVRNNLTEWVNGLGYGAWIQFSDIHEVLRRTAGVDNARLKAATDTPTSTSFGIQTYSRNGLVVKSTYVKDFRLKDSQLASMNALNIVLKAENTFGGA